MKKVMKAFAFAASVSVIAFATTGCAAFAGILTDEQPLLKGPPVRSFVSPYHDALVCLKSQLSPAQKAVSWGVMSFRDGTGRGNLAQGGVGTFSTQAGADRLVTSLFQTGVNVALTADPDYTSLAGLYINLGKQGAFGDGNIYTLHLPPGTQGIKGMPKGPIETRSIPYFDGTLQPVDIAIKGAITAADVLPGGGGDLRIMGIGGGVSTYAMNIGMSAYATTMPTGVDEVTGDHRIGGRVVAVSDIMKQIVGYKADAGIASFFNSAAYTEVSIGKDDREPIQLAEGVMLDRVAYDLVSQKFGITACEPQRRYAEALLAPTPVAPQAVASEASTSSAAPQKVALDK